MATKSLHYLALLPSGDIPDADKAICRASCHKRAVMAETSSQEILFKVMLDAKQGVEAPR